MSLVEPIAPESYRRLPWKNGRGELIVIDSEGGDNWQNGGVAWHFGHTAIVEEGPFSDYTGYTRLQVVIKGAGLVLIGPDHEIDLRHPMQPRRYDGGIPIRTRLENGPVEVVNLIADRAQFDIELQVAKVGVESFCTSGLHIVFAPAGKAQVAINGSAYTVPQDHALRVRSESGSKIIVKNGQVLVGSIYRKSEHK